MKSTFYLLIFSAIFFSCSDNDSSGGIDGTYSGTFYRITNGAKEQTSNVTLTFSNNQYSGTSSMVKYPALCSGTFTETPQAMTFANTCMWTAEFDWTLILNGEFKVIRKDDELILAKEYNADNGDYYILKKGASSL